jgi:hypothetical protein
MKPRQALGGLVVLLALAGAGAGLSLATPAHALEPAAAQDTTTTTTTTTTPEPNPDPAPAPSPSKPKPASKPAPKPVQHSPTPVYHAPVHTTPRTYTPTYTPTHATVTHHHVKKHRKHVVANLKPAPKPPVQPTTTTIPQINVGTPAAAVTAPATSDALRRTLVIAGIGLAVLLFGIVLAVPATAARFTAPGRVVIDHQTDLVLAGLATLLLTALLFAVTGGG